VLDGFASALLADMLLSWLTPCHQGTPRSQNTENTAAEGGPLHAPPGHGTSVQVNGHAFTYAGPQVRPLSPRALKISAE